jgi:hypothetical protein
MFQSSILDFLKEFESEDRQVKAIEDEELMPT